MKIKIGVCLAVVLVIFSCTTITNKETAIYIENATSDVISVMLYPNVEYQNYRDWYNASDYSGAFSPSNFQLTNSNEQVGDDQENEQELFRSKGLAIEPYVLAQEIFDSIYVTLADGRVIKFRHDTVIGYSDNLFSKESAWKNSIKNYDMPTMFRKLFLESYCFTVTIR